MDIASVGMMSKRVTSQPRVFDFARALCSYPGATVHSSESGFRTTVGIPDAGIWYNENQAHTSPPVPETDPKAGMSIFPLLGLGFVLLFVRLLVFG